MYLQHFHYFLQDLHKKKQDAFVKGMKKKGYDVQNIVVPLPYYGCLTKYSRDKALKAFLKPYQIINPFKLRKLIVD